MCRNLCQTGSGLRPPGLRPPGRPSPGQTSVPLVSTVQSRLSFSAQVRIFPAKGPYLKGSLGTVVTPSRSVSAPLAGLLTCASFVALPEAVTRQTAPPVSPASDPVPPLTTIRSPPKTLVLLTAK